MTITQYASVVKRWWFFIVIPTVLVTVIGLSSYQTPQTIYKTTVRLSAAVIPENSTSNKQFDESYYSWLSSEYLVSGLADWAVTGIFAQSVSDELASISVVIPANMIQNAISSDYVRSEVILYVNSADLDDTINITQAAIKVMQQKNSFVFPQLGGRNAEVIALDVPFASIVPPNIVHYLQPVVRILTGFVLGLFMVVCVHYFDPFIRNRADVEKTGIQVIVEL